MTEEFVTRYCFANTTRYKPVKFAGPYSILLATTVLFALSLPSFSREIGLRNETLVAQ